MSAKFCFPFLATLVLVADYAYAEEIAVGEETIVIPRAQSFWPLPSRTPQYDLMMANVYSENVRLVTFIPEKFGQDVTFGKVVSFDRWYAVEIEETNLDQSITLRQFLDEKESRQAHMDQVRDRILSAAPDLADTSGRQFKQGFDIEKALSLSEFVPVTRNETDELALSYSIYFREESPLEAGGEKDTILSTTTVYMLVNDKPLEMYAMGNAEDIGWTRRIMNELTAKTLFRNSEAYDQVVAEREAEARGNKAVRNTIGIVLLAVLFSTFAWWRSSTKSRALRKR